MILTGLVRLGRDAEVRSLADGTAVANLSLAYNHGKKDGDGKRPTQWIDASLWGDRATKLAEYLTKGTQIDVVLEDVHGEEFERRDGGSGYSLRARVVSLEFASKPADQRGEQKPAREAAPTTKAKPLAAGGHGFDSMIDDVPF